MNLLLKFQNYYLKWKQRDQEYYKLSARKGVDLYKILGLQ